MTLSTKQVRGTVAFVYSDESKEGMIAKAAEFDEWLKALVTRAYSRGIHAELDGTWEYDEDGNYVIPEDLWNGLYG